MILSPVYEDNHLLVVNKPAGLLVQGDHTKDPTLLDLGKEYLKEKYNKPGNVYLGLVHRLDRPVSGLVILARTSKAASRISESIRKGAFAKTYTALAEGHPPNQAEWRDHLVRDEQHSRVAGPRETGKEAILRMRTIERDKKQQCVRLEIDLITGRHHQIRVQCASRNFPLLGDFRYGSKRKFGDREIALHATEVTLMHPTTKESMTFRSEPAW